MSKDQDYFVGMAAGFIFVVLALIVLEATPKQITKQIRQEAVRNGHAHFVVGNDQEVTFVWNDCTPTPDALKADNANFLKGEVKK